MNPTTKYPLLFFCAFVFFIAALFQIDRFFFKNDNDFCERFLYSSLPFNSQWDLPAPSQEELAHLDKIFDQKFYYLAKGAHCFAFISEDKKHVIKFHRYASHFRIFPWLTHPFSYLFSKRRHQIKEHNIGILNYNLANYKESFEQLKEESGLLLVHINKTDYFKKAVTLVDRLHAEHKIPLDQVTFIVQHRADLLYPTLDRLYANGEFTKAKQVISQVIQLIITGCQKGYIDQDPVLHKNYGLLEDRAIHIDIGDLVKDEAAKQKDYQIAHVAELTILLKERLEKTYPLLYPHYQETLSQLAAKEPL